MILRRKIVSKLELDYVKVGDDYLPDLMMEPYPKRDLGKYGLLRLRYLREHRPIVWAELVMEGKLYAHPLETGDAANDLLESMMPGICLATKSSAPQLCWGAFLHQFYNT